MVPCWDVEGGEEFFSFFGGQGASGGDLVAVRVGGDLLQAA